jgi:hypothetical protein
MKKCYIRNSIIAGVLCTALIAPSLALGEEARPVLTRDTVITPISYELGHWSRPFLEQLLKKYDVGSVFKDKNADTAATEEDFLKLVKKVLDEKYDGKPQSMTREAVVDELTRIWADKAGLDLKNIAVAQMLIYTDTSDITAKYNHSITVAYMKNIAKGRGNGIFDPKAFVTYGELATLMDNTDKAIAKELQPSDQGIVRGRFETRGTYEINDNKVVFDFELMSHYTINKNLKFSSGQQFEIVITDQNGEEVYRFSDNKFFTMALLLKTVIPGEAIKWQDQWNMTNKKGEKLTSGSYKAKITIMVAAENDDEKIKSITFPTNTL